MNYSPLSSLAESAGFFMRTKLLARCTKRERFFVALRAPLNDKRGVAPLNDKESVAFRYDRERTKKAPLA